VISLACQTQQGLERRHRRIPAVKTECKFIEAVLQVFWIHAVVGAVEPSFEVAEGAMNMKGVRLGIVQFMVITCQRGFGITLPAIGIDHAPGLDVTGEKTADGHRIGTLGQVPGADVRLAPEGSPCLS